ncbi:MAG: LacI family DNA-binding transcriptional regulator, partial [Pseudomonadota bacterium]
MTAPETRKRRANLRDVARAADVSVATVSRVLNSPASVSDGTRARVEAVIERLRFTPSAAARAMNSGRSRTVGALVPTLDHAIFARFLSALEARLSEDGLSLVVATTGGDAQVELEKAKGLLEIGVEGLIVSGIARGAAFAQLTDRTQVPVIATSYYDPACGLPTIGYDNRVVAQAALEHLCALGHRTIAVLHGPRRNNDRTEARIAGILERAEGLSVALYEAEIGVAGGSAAVARLVEGGLRQSALLCLSDVLAVGALFEFQRRGIGVPGQISIMGIDDLPGSSCTVPALSTVRLPVSDMGGQAAAALARWLETGV